MGVVHLGEEAITPNVPTYHPWERDQLEYVIEHIGELVVKPVAEAGGYGRYRFRTINPFPDFTHGFVIPNEKPRLYRWFPDARCPDRDRLHQYVLSDKQRATPPEEHRWGCAMLSGVTLYHLNALRAIAQGSPRHARRVLDNGDGTVTWRGGKQEFCAHVDELPDEVIPEVIAELGRSTL